MGRRAWGEEGLEGAGKRTLCPGSGMRPTCGEGWRWGAEKCGHRLHFRGAEGKRWWAGLGKAGSRWGVHAGELPAGIPVALAVPPGREGAHPEAGQPLPAPAALGKSWRGSRREAVASPHSGPTAARRGEAGRTTRGLGGGGWGGAAGGSSS